MFRQGALIYCILPPPKVKEVDCKGKGLIQRHKVVFSASYRNKKCLSIHH